MKLASSQVRSRVSRILIGAGVGLVLAAVILGLPSRSRGAATATQASSNVVVIPGFAPAAYPGTQGVPPLPVSSPQLAAYHFSQLAPSQVTSSALAGYDTVVLYGIRWSDLSGTAQAAINAFASTRKVVIWDADDTGAQNYASFIQPFSTLASGGHGLPGASVVTYPTGADFLASDMASSPYFLDPQQLVSNPHMINHMSVMRTGTVNWAPGLKAANRSIPLGGWVVAWTYGTIRDHTGLLVYSGIDADAFTANLSPNYAVKELALDLAAPFSRTPAPCGPTCQPPSGGGVGTPYAACNPKAPKHWVHGRVHVAVKTSVAAGITARIITGSGRILASGPESGDLVRLVVRTKKLPSNRTARLRAVVFVNGQKACVAPFRLKVDNTRPRFLRLATRGGSPHLAYMRVSERVTLRIVAAHVHRRRVLIAARKSITLHLPTSVRRARLILTDRAGNTVKRRLVW